MLLCFFFHDPAPTEIYTLSLHDALPISSSASSPPRTCRRSFPRRRSRAASRSSTDASRSSRTPWRRWRSEEHTSELQSLRHLVCRLLLEKKKKRNTTHHARITTTILESQ